MGKDLEALLSAAHAEAGRSLKKVVASKGKLQGNLYFAGDGKASAGVAITLTARDPKGQKVLAGGKSIRKQIKGAKFGRGTVIMDGGKLVIELSAGTATAAMLKKAFKEDTFKKDAALKLLSRATIRKTGAPGVDAEVAEGTGLDQADLDSVSDAFEARGFWRKSELKELMKAQGSLSAANDTLQTSFLSVSMVQEEEAERLSDITGAISMLNERLSQAVDDGDREAAMGYELLILSEERKLAEAQAVGIDPFTGGTIEPSVLALMSRVQGVPLERAALAEAREAVARKRRSGFMKTIFAGLLGKSSGEAMHRRASDAIQDAQEREHAEAIRLELDSALEPLLIAHGTLDTRLKRGETAEVRADGAAIIEKIQALIDRAHAELSRLRARMQP
ncbi:MAG: hypothetical protein P8R54_30415 [Myxococcota bacterium]|nr:hypothetical protein [Myxococcota bacterium]